MKFKGLSGAVLALGLCFTTPSLQADTGWQEVINQSGIKLSQRVLPGKIYKQIQGEMTIPGNIAQLTGILNDPKLCAQWLNDCRASKVVKQINTAERINYTVVDAPFMLEDRDMYIHSKAQYDSRSETITILLRGVENFATAVTGKVRVKSLNGFWRFHQLDAQNVRVSYQMYSDPQVTPVSAVNASTPKGLLKTFTKLRKLVNSPALRNLRFKPGELEAITVR